MNKSQWVSNVRLDSRLMVMIWSFRFPSCVEMICKDVEKEKIPMYVQIADYRKLVCHIYLHLQIALIPIIMIFPKKAFDVISM